MESRTTAVFHTSESGLRRLVSIAVVLLSSFLNFTASAETAQRENGMVHRNGNRIVDGEGRPLKLRGVNLGGWLLWEPWMWGGHLLASESKLSERLESAVGQAEMARFRQEVYENYITEADIQKIASLGFNVVRVPINHTIFENGAPGWQILDRLLSWADRYHVYVVLDLHSAPGGQAKIFTANPEANLLWDSSNNQSRTLSLWKSIAERYRDRRILAGYDILNEPDPRSGSQLTDIDRRIVTAIREVDPSHMIIVEGAKFASDFSMFSELLTQNQIYSFHMYAKKEDNRSERMSGFRRLSKDQNVPIWCGEFGENKPEIIASTLALLDDPNNNVAGWAFWTWKRGPTANPTLVTIDLPPQWRHVVERDSSPLALGKPGRAQTLVGMHQFVQAIRLDHARVDPRMVSILTSHLRR